MEGIRMPAKVSGEGPALVLVPGGITGWIDWEPFIEVFAKERKVVSVQPINVQWGLEKKPLPSDYSVRKESFALALSLDEIVRDEVVDIMAWSYGGVIALDYGLGFQEKIRSMILIEPPALWVLKESWPEIIEKQKSEVDWSLNGEISEEMLERFLYAVGLSSKEESPRTSPQWSSWVKHRYSLRSVLALFDHSDSMERLRAFQKPVLLVKGKDSDLVLHRIIEILKNSLPLSEVLELPGGHAMHFANKEIFVERVKSFLKKRRCNSRCQIEDRLES